MTTSSRTDSLTGSGATDVAIAAISSAGGASEAVAQAHARIVQAREKAKRARIEAVTRKIADR
jgi:protein involved in polysaccharide export with SLBB domain